jgi:hypothetical protein
MSSISNAINKQKWRTKYQYIIYANFPGVPEENHWTATNHCQTLSHNVV